MARGCGYGRICFPQSDDQFVPQVCACGGLLSGMSRFPPVGRVGEDEVAGGEVGAVGVGADHGLSEGVDHGGPQEIVGQGGIEPSVEGALERGRRDAVQGAAPAVDDPEIGFLGAPGKQPLLGTAESLIGIALITGLLLRPALALFFAHMAGVFTSLALLPGQMWHQGVPTLEGQYVLKNLVLVAACLTVTADEFTR
jgi:hypothetical protein